MFYNYDIGTRGKSFALYPVQPLGVPDCYYHQVQQLDKNLHSWGYCRHFVPIPTQEGISVFLNEDDIAY